MPEGQMANHTPSDAATAPVNRPHDAPVNQPPPPQPSQRPDSNSLAPSASSAPHPPHTPPTPGAERPAEPGQPPDPGPQRSTNSPQKRANSPARGTRSPPDEQHAPGHGTPEDPRPPARPLDTVDRNIVRLLRADGRASVRSVAERVHISRANAYTRINRLLDDGVIRGFSARVDHERAGQGASAYITLKIVQDTWRSVREQLRDLPGVSHMALVSGDFDVLLLVHTADNRALRDLVLTRIQSIPEVISTHTLLVFEETDLEPEPGPDP